MEILCHFVSLILSSPSHCFNRGAVTADMGVRCSRDEAMCRERRRSRFRCTCVRRRLRPRRRQAWATRISSWEVSRSCPTLLCVPSPASLITSKPSWRRGLTTVKTWCFTFAGQAAFRRVASGHRRVGRGQRSDSVQGCGGTSLSSSTSSSGRSRSQGGLS